MKIVSKADLKLETFDKCSLICDSDCPLGTLYDYSCALKSFIFQRMKEQEEKEKAEKEKEKEVVEADQNKE